MNRLLITACIFLWLALGHVLGQDSSYHFGLSITSQHNIPRFHKIDTKDDASSFGINAQFDFYYKIDELLQLATGINLSKIRISKIDYSPRFPCDITPAGADIFNSWFEDRYDIVYLGIPFSVKKRIPTGGAQFYLRFGAELLIKVNESKQSLIISKCGEKIELEPNIFNPLASTVLVGQFGIGYEMAINETSQLLVEPQLNYSLTSYFHEDSLVDDVTNNLGLTGVGMRVSFLY